MRSAVSLSGMRVCVLLSIGRRRDLFSELNRKCLSNWKSWMWLIFQRMRLPIGLCVRSNWTRLRCFAQDCFRRTGTSMCYLSICII
ncbi:hypothetical protein D3C86_1900300 [compost metagenome]